MDIVHILREEEKQGLLYSYHHKKNNLKKETNKSLVELEKYRLIFEMSPIGITTSDKKGTILDINKAGAAITGHTPEELIGKNFVKLNLINKKTISKLFTYLPKIIQNKSIGPLELNVVDKKGKNHTVEVRVSPIRKNGKFIGTQAMMHDITNKKIAEEDLKATKDELDRIVNSSPLAILTVDTKGYIKSWNPACEQIFGWTEKEVLGKFNPTVPKQVKESYIQNIKKKQVNAQFKVLRNDGNFVDILLSTTPFYDKRGNFSGALALMTDNSKEKRNEEKIKESEEKYRTIFELAPDGIITMNMKGFITSVNPAFLSLSGFYEKEIVGKHFTNLPTVFKSDIKSYAPIIKTLLLGGSTKSINFKWKKKNGEHRLGQAKMSVMTVNGKRKGIQGIVRDITDEKKAEEELKEAHIKLQEINKNLEKMVFERTEEVHKLLKQKDEFINQMGHDLKNPLGPFIQLLPLLKKNINQEKDKKMIEVLERNAWYMKNLVNKTIELAKLNSSKIKFNFEPMNLLDIVNEVCEVNITMFDENNLDVNNKVSPNLMVKVDKLRIEEVFSNLFNNAVKYTDGPGKITINAEEKNDEIIVSVRDNGIGITKEQKNRLFDEYYKADSSRHDFDSSGLGLPICKRIIENHGGKIWVESDGLGKGSTFYFTIPKLDL